MDYRYSLADETPSEYISLAETAAIAGFDDYTGLPSVAESWNTLIGNDLRAIGRFATKAFSAIRTAYDTAMAFGHDGIHASARYTGEHLTAYGGRHTNEHIYARQTQERYRAAVQQVGATAVSHS